MLTKMNLNQVELIYMQNLHLEQFGTSIEELLRSWNYSKHCEQIQTGAELWISQQGASQATSQWHILRILCPLDTWGHKYKNSKPPLSHNTTKACVKRKCVNTNTDKFLFYFCMNLSTQSSVTNTNTPEHNGPYKNWSISGKIQPSSCEIWTMHKM